MAKKTIHVPQETRKKSLEESFNELVNLYDEIKGISEYFQYYSDKGLHETEEFLARAPESLLVATKDYISKEENKGLAPEEVHVFVEGLHIAITKGIALYDEKRMRREKNNIGKLFGDEVIGNYTSDRRDFK